MTATINEQLHKVRESGEVNMFDLGGVQRVARRKRLNELAAWLAQPENQNEAVGWVFGRATIEPEAAPCKP